MEKRINELIDELIKHDLSLKGKEQELRKSISEFAKARPETEPDPVFTERLRDELIRRFPALYRKKPDLFGFLARHRVKWVVGASAVAALVTVTIVLNPIAKMQFSQSPAIGGLETPDYIVQEQGKGASGPTQAEPSTGKPAKPEQTAPIVAKESVDDESDIQIAEGVVVLDKSKTDLQPPPSGEDYFPKTELSSDVDKDKFATLDDGKDKLVEAEDSKQESDSAKMSKLKTIEESSVMENKVYEAEKPKYMDFETAKGAVGKGDFPAPAKNISPDILLEYFDFIVPQYDSKKQTVYIEMSDTTFDGKTGLILVAIPAPLVPYVKLSPVLIAKGETKEFGWIGMNTAPDTGKPLVIAAFAAKSFIQSYGKYNVTLGIRYIDEKTGKPSIVEQEIVYTGDIAKTSAFYRFYAAVLEWTLLLKYKNQVPQGSFENVLKLAEGAYGAVPEAQRQEFIETVKQTISAE